MKNLLRTTLLAAVCGCMMAASNVAPAQVRGDDWRDLSNLGRIFTQRSDSDRWRESQRRREWSRRRHDNGRHLGWRIGVGNQRKRWDDRWRDRDRRDRWDHRDRWDRDRTERRRDNYRHRGGHH